MEGTQCDASAAEKASAEPRDARPHRPFAGEKGAATRCSWTDVAAAHGQAHHDDEVARRWPMRVERWAWSVERGAWSDVRPTLSAATSSSCRTGDRRSEAGTYRY